MTVTEQEQLAKKIEEANASELVVLMLEGMKNRFDDGIAAVEHKDKAALNAAVDKARAILGELLATLWGDSEMAISTRQIYYYLNKLVTDAGNRQVTEPLEEAKKVLNPLLEGWKHIAKNPQSMEAAPTKGPSVMAGMTYGKGALNESILNGGDRLGKG